MIKKWILLLCLWLPLSGCVPVAVVAVGAAVGGVVLYDNRSLKTRSQDNQIAIKANQSIRQQSDLRGKAHVKVAVYNGIGLVTGHAVSQKEKDEIGALVASTPNVRRMYNEIQLGDGEGTLSNMNDAWLASKVRTDLLLKPGLRSVGIRIEAEAGTVYLMGLVSRQQADLAAKTASQVAGVKRVVKVFEYE